MLSNLSKENIVDAGGFCLRDQLIGVRLHREREASLWARRLVLGGSLCVCCVGR